MNSEVQCDVLVVGGGIHGVGVAQAAAAAGYSVKLCEQTTLAAGTSSKSSKLIHGGLRYLEQAQFKLVRESIHERELLLRIAPSLVQRHWFHIPVYPQTKRSGWWLRAGLSVYAVLGGLRRDTCYSSVPKAQWGNLDGLRTDGLQAVFRYSDAKTDDRLLTEAVMRSAESCGAELLCPVRVTRIQIDDDGCTSELDDSGMAVTCRSAVVVNAAGPWANRVIDLVQPEVRPCPVDLVQGTHIELPGEITQGSYYLESPQDGRAVFVMPWYGRTLVGTTEHVFEGDPGSVRPLDQEIEYLLAVTRHYFPERATELLDAWAGLRVLPAAQGAAFSRSRETQLPVDHPRRPRFISIFGGKLTGYRITAGKVMERLAATLPPRTRQARTEEMMLE
ncbi:MAG: FAD-dependent oxidoreductase [Planctomycetales bacterium]|nr:FAD-dependent oxidoreductase [Planctomycetales bacterium]